MDKRRLFLTLGTVGLVLGLIVVYGVIASRPGKAGVSEAFAQCLTEKGAKMFGAYWCPHCQTQKKQFGKSFEKINYIECSLPDGKTQTETCRQAGIQAYPTWEFGDGSRLEGAVSFETLASKTGCELKGGE